MKIVVGLGNPGQKYAETKHNVGFWAVDELVRRFGGTFREDNWQALSAEVRIGMERVLFLKPQTFMNLSGDALFEAVQYFKEVQPARDVCIIYDDMDFAPGVLKLRESGSAGGHNGVKSVISRLGSESFARVRIGIGRPGAGRTVIDHVLSPFPAADRLLVREATLRAADAVVYGLEHDFSAAMNRFNASS
ncbi:MAG: aminoacyl-tRNA hydrolase [Alicyclobacillus sp. RIFOXYA1_FULL_53_8]|nr:MAG: aminoacyl-tRNA hydrolase [Alicyclobacillus sp. RIFOXYA1_FULL_53_8]